MKKGKIILTFVLVAALAFAIPFVMPPKTASASMPTPPLWNDVPCDADTDNLQTIINSVATPSSLNIIILGNYTGNCNIATGQKIKLSGDGKINGNITATDTELWIDGITVDGTVSADGGDVIMLDGVVTGGGNGIDISNGNFYMTGGEISYNTGSGLRVFGSGNIIEISDALITHNNGYPSVWIARGDDVDPTDDDLWPTVTIKNTEISYGGWDGLRIDGAYTTIEDATIKNNGYIGVINFFGEMKIFGDTVISDNKSSGVTAMSGPGLDNYDASDSSAFYPVDFPHAKAKLEVYGNTVIRDNENEMGGGGIIMRNAELDMYDHAKVLNNSAPIGGGILAQDSDVKIRGNAVISGNTAELAGGGLLAMGGNVTISDNAEISNNVATSITSTKPYPEPSFPIEFPFSFGGGVVINAFSSLTMTGGTISENKADYGGGIAIGGEATGSITGGKIIDNTARDYGGGIATLNNTMADSGAVPPYEHYMDLSLLSNLTITSSATFSGNKAGSWVDEKYIQSSFKATHVTNVTGFSAGDWSEPPTSGTPHAYGYNNYDINFAKVAQTITFDPEGGEWGKGSGDEDPLDVVAYWGDDVGDYVPSPGPSRDNYKFMGWYTDTRGTGTELKPDATVTDDVSYFAYWVSSDFTVTFDPDGGEWGYPGSGDDDPYSAGAVNGDNYGDILPNPPHRDGYTFKGWFTGKGGTDAELDPDDEVKSNGTYYAYWVEKGYEVTVNGSYATETGAGKYPPGETVKIYAGSRNGYTFSGWTWSGAQGVNITITNPGSADGATFIMPDGDVTVTANWTQNSTGDYGGGGDPTTSTPPASPSTPPTDDGDDDNGDDDGSGNQNLDRSYDDDDGDDGDDDDDGRIQGQNNGNVQPQYANTPEGELPAPPVVQIEGNTMVQVDDFMYIEYDADGVALGAWVYDADEDMWFFDTDVPLAAFALPRTGLMLVMPFAAAGFAALAAGRALRDRKNRREK